MEMRKRKKFTSLIFMALTSFYLLDGLEFKRKFGVLKSKRTKKGQKKKKKNTTSQMVPGKSLMNLQVQMC